jgi:nucleotide-binding universal stress UspA family protein
MFTHVLLPTDGSKLSENTIRKGVQLARSMSARVTGLSVTPKLRFSNYDSEIPGGIKEAAARQCRAMCEERLNFIRRAAEEAGVVCQVVSESDDEPYEAIIRTAETRGCDLIMMASHGRRGVAGILLGSETQKVLTHSKIPVLVFR